VAVGFTTGVRDAAGQTVVRGIDAHAWPEVYLDGTWVSFEPTPEQPSGELSPPGVIGVTAVGTPNPVAPVTIPKSLPKTTLPPPVPPPPTPAAVAPSSSAWWPWAVGGGVFVVALATGVVLRRRRRRRPADELVSAWRRVDRALARRALARPPWRTPLVHTRALRAGAQGKGSDDLWKDLEWLATSLEETTYGHRPVDAELAHQARGASHRVTRALHRSVTV